MLYKVIKLWPSLKKKKKKNAVRNAEIQKRQKKISVMVDSLDKSPGPSREHWDSPEPQKTLYNYFHKLSPPRDQ